METSETDTERSHGHRRRRHHHHHHGHSHPRRTSERKEKLILLFWKTVVIVGAVILPLLAFKGCEYMKSLTPDK